MTGGLLVVLGKVGRNFGAGMSGGFAYVLDEDGSFDYYCNKGMVELSQLQEHEDIELVKDMITKHVNYTDSPLGKKILENWSDYESKL